MGGGESARLKRKEGAHGDVPALVSRLAAERQSKIEDALIRLYCQSLGGRTNLLG